MYAFCLGRSYILCNHRHKRQWRSKLARPRIAMKQFCPFLLFILFFLLQLHLINSFQTLSCTISSVLSFQSSVLYAVGFSSFFDFLKMQRRERKKKTPPQRSWIMWYEDLENPGRLCLLEGPTTYPPGLYFNQVDGNKRKQFNSIVS